MTGERGRVARKRSDQSVIAWVIVAEGGNPAYPGFSAAEPKMVPWVYMGPGASALSYRTLDIWSLPQCLRAHRGL